MKHVPGLLIVEGNADRLQREGTTHHIDNLERSLAGLVARGQLRVTRFKVCSQADLDFARTFASIVRYDAVLLVAHGNTEGAEVAATDSLSWAEIAELIAPVQPRALLAIACMAASGGPAKELFEGIPTLAVVGGSPTTLTIKQAELAFVELLFAAFGLVLPSPLSAMASIFNASETGGIVFWRHREAFEQTSAKDLLEQDVLAVVAKTILDIDRLPRRRAVRRFRRVAPRTKTVRPLGIAR